MKHACLYMIFFHIHINNILVFYYYYFSLNIWDFELSDPSSSSSFPSQVTHCTSRCDHTIPTYFSFFPSPFCYVLVIVSYWLSVIIAHHPHCILPINIPLIPGERRKLKKKNNEKTNKQANKQTQYPPLAFIVKLINLFNIAFPCFRA